MKIWILILASALLRLWFSITIGLGDDEAYYWDWARQINWSYYDHPPMTAWLISLSSFIWGDIEWGVRFFSWFFTTASSVFIFLITRRLFNERAGFWATLFFTMAPIYSLGGILMVPDAPMMMAWFILLYLFLPDNKKQWDSVAFWVGCGGLLGFGLLSKYTMILMMASVFLYLFCSSERRKVLFYKGPWLGGLVSFLCFIPVVIWNYKYDWPSFTFHFSDRHQSSGLDLGRFGEFIGSQMGFLTPFFFFLLLVVLWVSFRRRGEERWSYIFWFSFPTLILFSIQSLFSPFKPHWAAPGYIPLLCASGYWISCFIDNRTWKVGRHWLLGCFLFLLCLLPTVFYVQVKFPFIHRIYASFNGSDESWKPNWDITNDLYGWSEAGKRVNVLYKSMQLEIGKENIFVGAHRYQLTGQLSFYSGIEAWSLNSSKDQYDFFLFNKGGMSYLLGKSAIILADNRYNKKPLQTMKFKKCEKQEDINFYRSHLLSHQFYIWKCYDFQGLK